MPSGETRGHHVIDHPRRPAPHRQALRTRRDRDRPGRAVAARASRPGHWPRPRWPPTDLVVHKDSAVTVFLYADDDDGDPLTYEVLTQPTARRPDQLSADLHVLRYTPDPGFVGTDSFTFRASDGTTTSNTATLTLDVRDPDAPRRTAPTRPPARTSGRRCTLSGSTRRRATSPSILDRARAPGTLGPGRTGRLRLRRHLRAARRGHLHRRRRHRRADGHVHLPRHRSGGHHSAARATVDHHIIEPRAPTAYDNSCRAGKDATTTLTVSAPTNCRAT